MIMKTGGGGSISALRACVEVKKSLSNDISVAFLFIRLFVLYIIDGWYYHEPITFQLIECPSVYELMACPDFKWENVPRLELWKENHDSNGNSNIMLESYSSVESISIFNEALSINRVSYYPLLC